MVCPHRTPTPIRIWIIIFPERPKTNQYTSLASLTVSDGYVFVQHRRKNFPNQPEFVLDIYDLEGHLRFFGLETPGYLVSVNGHTYNFVDKDERDYGSITIGQYVLNDLSESTSLAHSSGKD